MRIRKYLTETTVTADASTSFQVPMLNREKFKKLNPKTNRMKISRKLRYLDTDIKPGDRSFDNLPRYADKKPKCHFKDWLCIKGERLESHSTVDSFGKAANGKWYGWSHRAVWGFLPGDEIKEGSIAYDEKRQVPYKIKDDNDAKWHAMKFASEVG